jgi:hypothetical protein
MFSLEFQLQKYGEQTVQEKIFESSESFTSTRVWNIEVVCNSPQPWIFT